jgi:N-acetylneuraminic acid mutarotase
VFGQVFLTKSLFSSFREVLLVPLVGDKRAAFIVLLVLFSVLATLPNIATVRAIEDSWATNEPMQKARSDLGVAVVNGKIYAIGGSTEEGYCPNTIGTDYKDKGWIVNTNEEYDPETDAWTFKKPMPTPRYNFGIAVYQNKIYCIGGVTDLFVGQYTKLTRVNEVYDPATDTWETKASMPDAEICQANVVGGKIYLIGGGSDGTLNQVYDPVTDSWTKKASMPESVRFQVSVVVDNKIHVIGFYEGIGLDYVNSKTFVYDPVTDSWSSGTPIPSDIFHGEGVPWRGNWWSIAAGATTGVMAPKRIYVFFIQYVYSGPLPNLVYNPATGNWTVGADVPTNRKAFGVVVVNDILYAIGGRTDIYPFPDDTYLIVEEQPVNEQYTPIGYGTPAPSYVPPDIIAPAISIISPMNEAFYNSDLPLIFNVSKSVSWMYFKLDDKKIDEIEGNSTLNGLSSGLHNLTIYATDVAGNTGVSETIYFTVDNTPPVVSVLSPENKKYDITEIPLNFTVNEEVLRMSYSLDGKETVPLTSNTISELPSGLHNIIIYAEDLAGNIGASTVVTFRVAETEVPPATLVGVAFGVSVVAVVAGLLLYFKKGKR